MAARCHHKRGGWVGELIMLAVVLRAKSEHLREFADFRGAAAQEERVPRKIIIVSDLRAFHCCRIGCGVLWIESHHHELKVRSWTQTATSERVRNDAYNWPAQRFAGEVRNNPNCWCVPQPSLERSRLVLLASQRQRRGQCRVALR